MRARLFPAVAVAVSMLVAGCSAPGVFPAVLADPTPRNDTPLSPEQVKQATADLISERERLCFEAVAQQDGHRSTATAPQCGAADPATTGATPNAGATVKP